MPEIQINFLAVGIAVVVNFFFGFIWYTPLFGKVWAKEMGFDPEAKPESGAMAKGMIIMVIGNFLMAWVLAHSLAAWNPETWNYGSLEASNVAFAGSMAFWTWLGFFVPVDLGKVAWEQKSWKLFGINTAYHFLSLFIVALVIMYMS